MSNVWIYAIMVEILTAQYLHFNVKNMTDMVPKFGENGKGPCYQLDQYIVVMKFVDVMGFEYTHYTHAAQPHTFCSWLTRSSKKRYDP